LSLVRCPWTVVGLPSAVDEAARAALPSLEVRQYLFEIVVVLGRVFVANPPHFGKEERLRSRLRVGLFHLDLNLDLPTGRGPRPIVLP